MAAALRLGIDTGGTFTDVVWSSARGTGVFKLASTPGDPADAVIEGIHAVLGVTGKRQLSVHHGTTVGTNAVLTRGGVRVTFVTTEGFEHLLHIGRGQRDDLHALAPARTAPLVELAQCVGVRERMAADGSAVTALKPSAVEATLRAVRRRRPQAVAICLLHAPRNDAHEQTLRDALGGACPHVFASADVSADTREVERATTTVLHAYVAPLVTDYTARLEAALPADALTVLRSDGGRMSAADVRAGPARTLLSGPAAGVAAARALAAAQHLDRVLTFDVGGTSTDVAWIEGAALPIGTELRVGEFTAGLPAIDMETVGAGGGSLVHLDAGGALCVGPASAGADPGPACYGNGGPFALTDAWLLLRRLPSTLLGGEFPLDARAARDAARPIAAAAGLSVPALCRGAVAVAAATTARALRLASAAKGRDPSDAALIAFGGAGPNLACDTATQLGMRTVLVPPEPGVFAARGALLAPLTADAVRVAPRTAAATQRAIRSLRREVQTHLRAEGASRVELVVEMDGRYVGQAFEVTVPLDTTSSAGWEANFHAAHEQRYGFASPERGVEAVRVRVRGEGHATDAAGARSRKPATPKPRRAPTPKTEAGRVRSLQRTQLAPGMTAAGPLRVDEHSGTTFVPTGWRLRCLADGTLEIRRSAR